MYLSEETGIKVSIKFFIIGFAYAAFLIFQLIAQGPLSNLDNPMTAADMVVQVSGDTVAERIAPVGKTKLKGQEDTTAKAAPAPAAPAVAAAPKSGEEVYNTTCFACHGTGILNSPKKGDSAAWSARFGGDVEQLLASSIKGKGAMPARGGNGALRDDEVRGAIEFMMK